MTLYQLPSGFVCCQKKNDSDFESIFLFDTLKNVGTADLTKNVEGNETSKSLKVTVLEKYAENEKKSFHLNFMTVCCVAFATRGQALSSSKITDVFHTPKKVFSLLVHYSMTPIGRSRIAERL